MMGTERLNFMGRALRAVAPGWHLNRMKARFAGDMLARHYEGASNGPRTANWHRSSSDANTVNGHASLSKLRDVARDLVRNNPIAENIVATIADHTVGWGIKAKVKGAPAAEALWKKWAESTACDADGRHNLYGIQNLIMRATPPDGEVLVRFRYRLPSDGLPIPLQLQVIEADLLDASKTMPLPNGGQIIQGVEFDAIGNRVAYWILPAHPGSTMLSFGTIFSPSRRIPASEFLHIFPMKRPNQVRGPSWFAPSMLRFKEQDEVDDAAVVKQKIAASLCVIATDVNGDSAAIGTPDDTKTPATDTISPGMIINAPPGRDIEVVSPPTTGDYKDVTRMNYRAIAVGFGLTYEDVTGDYTGLPFSAARMSRLRHWARVMGWQWKMLIPQFCEPVFVKAMQVAMLAGILPQGDVPEATWYPPPMPMIEPDKEGLAIMRNVRAGIQTLEEALSERGYDVDEFIAAVQGTNEKLDKAGIVLDSDPRHMTQAGQAQGSPSAVGKASKKQPSEGA